MTKIYVLVVDDEADVELLFRQKFRREVKDQKVEFDFALSANEALSYLDSPASQAKTTLVLSDINMPGMNGLELLRVIKEKYPKVLVFILTAYGDEQSQKLAQTYGSDDFLNKPVDFNQLKQKIFNLACHQAIPS